MKFRNILVLSLMIVVVWAQDDDEEEKKMRRSEVSRALGLLKKHSIVGSNAKIVLKPNGKHLLVDPSERLRVVSTHNTKRSSDSSSSSSSSPKSAKLQAKKMKSSSSKKKSSSSTKRSSNGKKRSNKESKVTSESRLSKRRITSSSSSSSPSQANIESLQRSIMTSAASKSANIVDSVMGAQMLTEITSLVTNIVRNKQAGSLVALSDLITDTLNEKYGGHWHTVAVASPKAFHDDPNTSGNPVLINSLQNQNQLHSLTHVALDDHQKSATFYVTLDFGRMLRVFIFK